MSSVDMLPAVVPVALAAPLPLSSPLVLPELRVRAAGKAGRRDVVATAARHQLKRGA
jgi:hypothetical protein